MLLLVAAVATPVAALVIYNLQPERFKLYTGQVQDSNFVVDSFVTRFRGPHRIIIAIVVRNTDTAVHSANVTVTLLNSSGLPIIIGGVEMVQSKLTGDVNGGATKTLIYIFTATNLVQAYHSPFVEIRDLS